MSDVVHYSDWAQQPDVRLACGRMTTPAWSSRPASLPAGVYETDDGDLYRFDRVDLVNCESCKEWLPR